MTIVYFNGPSRNQLINTFPLQQIEIGCNHIRRDRPVQHVVVFDRVKLEVPIEEGVKYYTRKQDGHAPIWNTVKDHQVDPINSGMLAVLLATKLSNDPIFIIGCDWGLNHDSVYDYGRVSPHKYTNSCNRHIRMMRRTHSIVAVHDQMPDIDCEIMNIKDFLQSFNK